MQDKNKKKPWQKSRKTVVILRKKRHEIETRSSTPPKDKKTANTPPPAAKKKKAKIPPPPPRPKHLRVRDNLRIDLVPILFRKAVYRHIDSLMPPIPWAVGIKKQLLTRMLDLPEYQGKKKRLRRCIEVKLMTIANKTEYLESVVGGNVRHGFDGYTEPITDEQKNFAAELLYDRNNKMLDRKAKKTDNLDKVIG